MSGVRVAPKDVDRVLIHAMCDDIEYLVTAREPHWRKHVLQSLRRIRAALVAGTVACGSLASTSEPSPPAPSSAPPSTRIAPVDEDHGVVDRHPDGGLAPDGAADGGADFDAGASPTCSADGSVVGGEPPCVTSDTAHTHVECCAVGPKAFCCASPRDAGDEP